MKTLAAQVSPSIQMVIAPVPHGLSPLAAAKLPQISSMKRTVQRTRQKLEDFPAILTSLLGLNIPENFKESNSGELFLLFDRAHHIIDYWYLPHEKTNKHMYNCDHWYTRWYIFYSPKDVCPNICHTRCKIFQWPFHLCML